MNIIQMRELFNGDKKSNNNLLVIIRKVQHNEPAVDQISSV